MDKEYHRLLYKNSPITLLESYIAIEKFIIDTRLAFIDQYKLFDLLKKLLPNHDNQLTSQGFLSWFVWHVDQHEEEEQQQQHRQTITAKRLLHDEYENATKRSTTNGRSEEPEVCSNSSLVHFTQRQFEHNTNVSSDVQQQQQIDRLQSIVLRLASNVDVLNRQSDTHRSSPVSFEQRIKHEQIEDNEPCELEIEEDHEDETSDANHRLDLPASTSTNFSFPAHPIPTKTMMYKGRNMMKHLRPRTTLTSFARHVASDLFSREEIMAKLHVDHHNERDIFLRHCICNAWNLTEPQLYLMWPKIRNALLQLRRDAIAGKCIRMNIKSDPHPQQQHQAQPQQLDRIQYYSDYEDDESQNKTDLCR